MTHYNYVSDWTDIDESGWELVCNTANLFIPKNKIKTMTLGLQPRKKLQIE